MKKDKFSGILGALFHKFMQETERIVSKDIKTHLFEVCQRHYNPGIKIADQLSVGIGQEYCSEQTKDYKLNCLYSIFDSIEVLYKIRNTDNDFKPSWYYSLQEISSGNEIFPLKIQTDEEPKSPLSEYQYLWTKFDDELKDFDNLQTDNFYTIFNNFFYLFQKYTWCIPIANNALPDVSLFDHLKTTAAIAGCLYDAEHEGTADNGKFLLFSADFSGIQAFIFKIDSAQGIGGISKRLRGRSFYIMMLNEILSRYIIYGLDLTLANINFCGGGNFELLLSNTQKTIDFLKKFEKDVNEWLVNKYSGQIALVTDWLAMSESDLMTRFGKVKAELHDKIALKKKRKFQTHLGSFSTEYPSSPIRICRSCNLTQIRKKEELCEDCKNHKKIGKALPKTEMLVFVTGESSSHTLPDNILDFSPFGKVYLLEKPDTGLFNKSEGYIEQLSLNHDSKGSVIKGFYNLSNVLPVSKKKMYLRTEIDPDDDESSEMEMNVRKDQTLSFSTLADMAMGDDKIGILKMDVDNLGFIFSLGLQHASDDQQSSYSIARISTLSRQLSYFLTNAVTDACNEVSNKWKDKSDWGKRVSTKDRSILNSDVSNIFYIVFSGGDDLFIVGPWDRIIDLADLLRKKFKDFTCHNPNITISAGIFICKPKYPISLAAKKAEEALHRSKSKEKNRITVFDETVVWDDEDKEKSRIFEYPLNKYAKHFQENEIFTETIFKKGLTESVKEKVFPFSRLLDFHNKLLELDEKDQMPRRFVYRLLEGKKRFFPVTYNTKEERYEEKQNDMIFPYLFYLMYRNLGENARKIIQKELITPGDARKLLRQMNIPAMMFLMKTRKF